MSAPKNYVHCYVDVKSSKDIRLAIGLETTMDQIKNMLGIRLSTEIGLQYEVDGISLELLDQEDVRDFFRLAQMGKATTKLIVKYYRQKNTKKKSKKSEFQRSNWTNHSSHVYDYLCC